MVCVTPFRGQFGGVCTRVGSTYVWEWPPSSEVAGIRQDFPKQQAEGCQFFACVLMDSKNCQFSNTFHDQIFDIFGRVIGSDTDNKTTDKI